MWTKNLIAITGTVYLCYLLIGGGIFMILDKYHALDITKHVKPNTSDLFKDMKTVLLKNFSESQIGEALKEWKKEFVELYFSNGTVELKDIDWTYANSFFFAFHLCSTVDDNAGIEVLDMTKLPQPTLRQGTARTSGYGDIFPDTPYGQLFVVFYTIVGMPLHSLLFTILGESFAQSYQDIMIRVKGDQGAPLRRTLGHLVFFIPWIIVFYVVPSIAFIFMENWHFIDAIYYCFITLTTIGLGDCVAGSKVQNNITFTLYKLLIFVWMLYGLAFTATVVNFMTHLYQMYMLFSFKCSCRKCKCKFQRVYVDVEKMDIHFRLIRAEAVKREYSMWSVRESTRLAVGFRTNHMISLAALCERIQGELMDLLKIFISSSTEILIAKSSKDASKILSKEKFAMKKSRKDAFPVRTREEDNSV